MSWLISQTNEFLSQKNASSVVFIFSWDLLKALGHQILCPQTFLKM